MKIDDKVTFYNPHNPDAVSTVSLKASAQYPGSKFLNSPYSLRNRDFCDTSTTAKNPENAKNYNLW